MSSVASVVGGKSKVCYGGAVDYVYAKKKLKTKYGIKHKLLDTITSKSLLIPLEQLAFGVDRSKNALRKCKVTPLLKSMISQLKQLQLEFPTDKDCGELMSTFKETKQNIAKLYLSSEWEHYISCLVVLVSRIVMVATSASNQ